MNFENDCHGISAERQHTSKNPKTNSYSRSDGGQNSQSSFCLSEHNIRIQPSQLVRSSAYLPVF